jgi:hypothetical protein
MVEINESAIPFSGFSNPTWALLNVRSEVRIQCISYTIQHIERNDPDANQKQAEQKRAGDLRATLKA